MSAVVIIPARYASTRLPGKPLLAETGKPLIQHVVESIRPSRRVQRIVVATDDQRIADAVVAFGGEAVMTRADHPCGTDRIAEAAAKLHLADSDIVVNVQGDEPDMPAACVDKLIELLEGSEPTPPKQSRLQRPDAPMATLATHLPSKQADDPNKVKVVLDGRGRAMYFSRSRIPFDRDKSGKVTYLLHLGIYAYRVGFLKNFAGLPPTPAEQAEKLEQLRALEHGHAIAVAVVDYHGVGIDTPADYAAFVARAGHPGP
ncbi:MAG: 3-deoxy-manno-octulosonate cytidylyltransferase [Phycisphaerae bacterium]|nr:3-deoxy-manno-octulosonate cytidylyltransferase [Phycisphaerae bacterium]